MTLFFQQWQGELLKLFARRRTYIGFGAFLLLEIVLLFVLRLQGVENVIERLISRQGQAFEHYFSAITLGYMVMRLSVFLLGALYLTLVSGDIVAKEGEDGHLRLLLVRPVSRLRLLFVKYLTCTGYAVTLVLFIALTAALLGLALKGWGGGLFAMAPEVGVIGFFDGAEAVSRYAQGALLLGLGMTTISSIAFFLSCFPIKPAAATIGALSYALIDMILRESRFMDSYEHFLITKHIAAWGRVFAESPDWMVILRSFTVLAAVNLTCFILGAAVFESRDLKS
jgi:ABC-2 type transport system permease protein